jgi:hypothetical protein
LMPFWCQLMPFSLHFRIVCPLLSSCIDWLATINHIQSAPSDSDIPLYFVRYDTSVHNFFHSFFFFFFFWWGLN